MKTMVPTAFTIPAKSTQMETVFTKPTDTAASTIKIRDTTSTETRDTASTTETRDTSVHTNPAIILGNNADMNLAAIIGGTLGGVVLLLLGIIVIFIIVMVLFKTKHKTESVIWARSVACS